MQLISRLGFIETCWFQIRNRDDATFEKILLFSNRSDLSLQLYPTLQSSSNVDTLCRVVHAEIKN